LQGSPLTWFGQLVADALATLRELLDSGKEARRLLENLLVYCRDLLMYQQAPQLLSEKSLQLTEAFQTLAKNTPPAKIYHWITVLNDTQNEVRFTNNPTIYLEVAVVKLANDPESAAVASNSADNSQEVAQLRQALQKLQEEVQRLQENRPAGAVAETTAPVKKAKATTTFRLPKERVFQVLKSATKKDLANVRNVWDDLLMSLSVTQRAMLHSSEAKAASESGVVIAFDYEILCQRASNDQEFQLMIHNQLSRMIKDYAPQAVFITIDSPINCLLFSASCSFIISFCIFCICFIMPCIFPMPRIIINHSIFINFLQCWLIHQITLALLLLSRHFQVRQERLRSLLGLLQFPNLPLLDRRPKTLAVVLANFLL